MRSTPSSSAEPDRARARWRIWALIAVCVAVPVALVIVATRHDANRGSATVLDTTPNGLLPKNAVVAGKAAPTFHLPGLDGARVDTKQLAGKPYVLTFWASWCIPCRKEMPLLQDAYAKQRVAVVGITYQDPASDSRAFARHYGITFPIAPDDGIRLANAFGVIDVPTTFFVNAQGVVTDRVFGIEQRKALEQPLTRLLAGATPPN